VHRRLETQFDNYPYAVLTTREPENIDAERRDFVGKQYLQDIFSSDNLRSYLDWTPEANHTHVFCAAIPR